MRTTFVSTLAELATMEESIVFLTADLGFMVIESFAERHPDRYFNVGVAEQNMVGLATGLAEAGFRPFCYSIATFASMRAYEFLRNGGVHHRLPVRVIGVGGGFEYGTAGPTHHGLEDVGLMRLQPGLTIVVPADHEQARSALMATWDLPGPIYYRLGKDEKNILAGLEGRFRLGRLERIREGSDVAFIAMGPIAAEVMQAAKMLAADGMECTVTVASTIAPRPVSDIVDLLQTHRTIITVESHYLTGGLGSMVAEIAAELSTGCRVLRYGVGDDLATTTGSQRFLERRHNISAESLARAAAGALSGLAR